MGKRILIIEDAHDFRELLTYRLKASGYELLTATNGKEGLELAQKEQPDLILTDLMLPQLNGYEVCTMLKQDVRFQHIPIFILSGTKMETKDSKLAEDCGADAFLVKTIEPKALLAKIHEALPPPS